MSLVQSPINLINQNTAADEDYMKDRFIEIIQKIYQYEIFKPFMDLTVTLIKEGRLKFKVSPKKFYELDEGNCVTIEGGVFDRLIGKMKRKNNYIITIKKIASDVIIHEIGHMVEKEIDIDLSNAFKKAMIIDLRDHIATNATLASAIKDVMVTQVDGYKDSHKLSEWFTRYFQLIAMSKEIAGYGAIYAYKVGDVGKAFPNIENWIWDNLYNQISLKTSEDIVNQSHAYIKSIDEIKHKWSEEKIEPLKGKKPWSKTVKSIKDI